MAVLEALKQHWEIPTKIAAWLSGLVGTFLFPPPLLSPYSEDTQLWLHLSQFLLAILLGLFFLGTPRNSRQRRRSRQIALVAGIVGAMLFVAYQALTPLWSCGYLGRTVIAGHTHLADAAQYLTLHPAVPCERLIAAALGYTENVWPRHELVQRYILLSTLYSAALLALSAAAMATINYLRTATVPAARGDGLAP